MLTQPEWGTSVFAELIADRDGSVALNSADWAEGLLFVFAEISPALHHIVVFPLASLQAPLFPCFSSSWTSELFLEDPQFGLRRSCRPSSSSVQDPRREDDALQRLCSRWFSLWEEPSGGRRGSWCCNPAGGASSGLTGSLPKVERRGRLRGDDENSQHIQAPHWAITHSSKRPCNRRGCWWTPPSARRHQEAPRGASFKAS